MPKPNLVAEGKAMLRDGIWLGPGPKTESFTARVIKEIERLRALEHVLRNRIESLSEKRPGSEIERLRAGEQGRPKTEQHLKGMKND